jgi:hypothetical protein
MEHRPLVPTVHSESNSGTHKARGEEMSERKPEIEVAAPQEPASKDNE